MRRTRLAVLRAQAFGLKRFPLDHFERHRPGRFMPKVVPVNVEFVGQRLDFALALFRAAEFSHRAASFSNASNLEIARQSRQYRWRRNSARMMPGLPPSK